MPAYRYYVDNPFSINVPVRLIGQEHQHFFKVMRGRVGDQIEVVNGRYQLGFADVLEIKRSESIINIVKIETGKPSTFKYIVAQGIAKLNRLEFIVEKCTELGATEFWLFPTERSEKHNLTKAQIERLNYIIISAMKQCGRLDAPKLIVKPEFHDWKTDANISLFYGDVSEEAPHFSSALSKIDRTILFIVGPESGFSLNECNEFKERKAQGVKLCNHILRTDTASITAIAIAQHFHENLR